MNNLQKRLQLGRDESPPFRASPSGYKGLSGFHKYWGKKPTEAWRLLIENITESNDVVLDPFLGSGLIAKECMDLDRRFIGFDINPISVELTNLYLQLPGYSELKEAIAAIGKSIESKINAMYSLSDRNIASHLLWEKGKVKKAWRKEGNRRVALSLNKEEYSKLQDPPPYKPRRTRSIRLFDNSRINSKKIDSLEDLFTPRALCAIDLLKGEIEKQDERVRRALLLTLTASLGQMSKMVFAVSGRGKTQGRKSDKIEVGSWTIGYWKPDQHFEINAWNCFENKARKLLNAVKESGDNRANGLAEDIDGLFYGNNQACVCMGDSESLLKTVPCGSVKVVLTDPPHGDRIPYLELSEMWNSVIGFDSDYAEELVISNAKQRGKDVDAYNRKLASIFTECARVLADNGLMAVMFNAREKKHWESFRKLETNTGLEYIGRYLMEYSAGSVVQDNRKGSLKKDFVLLYGKNISKDHRNTIADKFNSISSWTTQSHIEE